MPDEEAEPLMKQWVRFKSGRSNILVARNEVLCQRTAKDHRRGAARRGPALGEHGLNNDLAEKFPRILNLLSGFRRRPR